MTPHASSLVGASLRAFHQLQVEATWGHWSPMGHQGWTRLWVRMWGAGGYGACVQWLFLESGLTLFASKLIVVNGISRGALNERITALIEWKWTYSHSYTMDSLCSCICFKSRGLSFLSDSIILLFFPRKHHYTRSVLTKSAPGISTGAWSPPECRFY